MGELRFAWNARKAAGNLRKHGVSFEEAGTAFGDEGALAFLGKHLEQDGSVAMRAAQAVCDIKKWPFTWGGEQQLPEVRERWKKEAP